tara:strand:+ start:9611 stop:10360 length:750 start_codon:yes stop_codon:yes gene_type:complete
MRQIDSTEPMVTIDAETWGQIMFATQAVDTEITGWLNVKRDEDHFHIHGDLVIPKQEVGSASVDVSSTEMALMLDQHDNVRCWWHSHVDMAPNPSTTDVTQMDGYAENLPFYLMLITNKSGNYGLEVWDMESNLIWEGIELSSVPTRDVEKLADIIKDNVKKKTFPVYQSRYPYSGNQSARLKNGLYWPESTPTYDNGNGSGNTYLNDLDGVSAVHGWRDPTQMELEDLMLKEGIDEDEALAWFEQGLA